VKDDGYAVTGGEGVDGIVDGIRGEAVRVAQIDLETAVTSREQTLCEPNRVGRSAHAATVNHAAVTQVHPVTTQGIGVRNRGHHAGSLEVGQKLLARARDTTDRLVTGSG
jgi:hypothetical protein